jgi:hypothetical protein
VAFGDGGVGRLVVAAPVVVPGSVLVLPDGRAGLAGCDRLDQFDLQSGEGAPVSGQALIQKHIEATR